MTPEARAYAERVVRDAPELSPEQVRRLALVLAPVARKGASDVARRH